jgi:hypothetical protein
MTNSPPGLAAPTLRERLAYYDTYGGPVELYGCDFEELRDLLRAHAELEADARRYRYMKRIVEGLKGVFSVHHVVGPKNILIMSVTSEHADEFIDRAWSK